ncbi:sulfite exporter TauE/SafE family protein [Cerasicoccus frondis]|uniref:sulfite exporter TauE/SafE family protein n=1 Tax=Cerasicoccus frondis TaxID=490090 RepID=UPI002852578F|nr:sulfite exporter TauE/SafE family protein [Cerasicoccus frondis]
MEFLGFTMHEWLFAALGAALIGLAKGGLPGAGNVSIWIFAEVFGAKESVGYLLPVLVCGDIVAIIIYRRNAEWPYVWRLLPPMAIGVVAGWMLFHQIPAQEFRIVMGFLLLVMTALHFGRKWMLRKQQAGEDKVPHSKWFIWSTGVAGGLATMLANAAGPVAAFYLMAVKLPKFAFIGTTAWLFFIINLFKLPFQAELGMVNITSIRVSLILGTVAALACLVAPRIVKYIPQKQFEWLVWGVIIFAGLRLIF